MFSLTIMYIFMFCYIRIQSRKLVKASSTSNSVHQPAHELRSWKVDVEAGDPAHRITPSQIFTMNSANVTTEDRPTQLRSRRPRADKRMNQVSLTLLCYPIMYIVFTMPLEVSRLSEFAGKNWSLTSVYFGVCLFMCSGFFNVLLYTTTRKGIFSWSSLFRKRKYESSKAPNHLSLYQPSSRPPVTVASKSSVSSLVNPLPEGPPNSHEEYDSVWSMESLKKDSTMDHRSTAEY